MPRVLVPRHLPEEVSALTDLALDVRWTWSHAGDVLWRMLDSEAWEQTRNPWEVLQNVPREWLDELAQGSAFMEELGRLMATRRSHPRDPGRYGRQHTSAETRSHCHA